MVRNVNECVTPVAACTFRRYTADLTTLSRRALLAGGLLATCCTDLDASCVRCTLPSAYGGHASSPMVGGGLGGRQSSADHSTPVPGSESELNRDQVRAPPGGMLVPRGWPWRSSPCSGDAIRLVAEAMATRARRTVAIARLTPALAGCRVDHVRGDCSTRTRRHGRGQVSTRMPGARR